MSIVSLKLVKKRVDATPLRGLVEVGGLKRLARYLDEQQPINPDSATPHEDRDVALDQLLAHLQEERNGQRVTDALVDACISKTQGRGVEPELVSVISAFDVPKISYDPIARALYANPAPRELFADADAKHRLYMDRLYLIQQRMRRSSLFQRKLGVQLTEELVGPQLTDLQSLRGVVGVKKIVLGCIMRGEDGRCVLEDLTASVPLDLSQAAIAAGFCTENCIVMAEGTLGANGMFTVTAMGFPPAEERANLPMCARHLNMFGGPALTGEQLEAVEFAEQEGGHEDDRVVVLADVWLDKPQVMDDLNTLFSGFSQTASVPAMFVLMGNFHSSASGRGGGAAATSVASGGGSGAGGAGDLDFATLRDLFNALASMIDQYPRIKSGSRFVFIPGPGDPCPSPVLPQAPLPNYFTGELRRVLPTAVFSSNPCRLRFLTSEVVLFRYDILKRLRRHCLMPPPESGGSTADLMWGQLALTLLQQSHLCPLPLLQQPIYWQHDHALHLYPLPHGVVVADTSVPPAEHTHQGSLVLNPGTFAQGRFAAYVPCSRKVEFCCMRDDGQGCEEEEEPEEEEEAGAGADDWQEPPPPADASDDDYGAGNGMEEPESDGERDGERDEREEGQDEGEAGAAEEEEEERVQAGVDGGYMSGAEEEEGGEAGRAAKHQRRQQGGSDGEADALEED